MVRYLRKKGEFSKDLYRENKTNLLKRSIRRFKSKD